MSVFTIRAHKRYALRSPSKMKSKSSRAFSCLLIELSQDGARISSLGDRLFEEGEPVTLTTADGYTLAAFIRWARDGCAGLRLAKPLHHQELSDIVLAARGMDAAAAKVA